MKLATSQPGPAAPSPRAPRPPWQRWGLRLLVAALIYTLIGFWLLPLIARSVAASQLRKALDREVAIDKVRFNPYTFVIEIHGLAVQDPDGRPLAGWDLVRVNFQFTSIFHGPWRFKEVTVNQLHGRVQINPDYTLNFSDLLEKPAAEEPTEPAEPAPLPRLRIDRLQIAGATLDFTDLTPSTPFRRRLGPIDLTLPDFATLSGHTNSVSLKGTTDAGERFAWDTQLWLEPPRLTGHLTLDRLDLTNYAALYQDFLQVQLRGGTVEFSATHDLLFDADRKVARLADQRFSLTGLRVGLPGNPTNLVELDLLTVLTPVLDVWERQATVQQVLIDGVRVAIRRLADEKLELVEVAKPSPTADHTPGSALFIFEAFTNGFALFSGSTNAAVALVEDIVLTNTAIALIDEAAARPAHATITDLAVRVRNLSNLPDSTPTATLSFRWQTNGIFNLTADAALTPPAANIELDIRDLDLSVLEAYLADQVNVNLLDSRFSLAGKSWIEAPPGQEPTGQFQGGLALEGLHIAHSLEDHNLLKWDGFRIDGITVNLHPLDVAIDRAELAAPELWAILNTNGTLNFLTAANIHRPLLTPAGSPNPPAEPDRPEAVPAAEPPASAQVGAAAPVPDPAPTPLPPVNIASFVLTNATLNLIDRMTVPEVLLTITNLNGELSELSSTNLQHADFDFEGRIRSGGTFALQGRVRPLDSTHATVARVSLDEIVLTPGSPYAARYLGYRLEAGKLTADLNYQVTGSQLQATNHIILDRFTLGARVDSPDALKVPIKLGLAVLQDRQGRIELTIPVSGSLDDPQFSLAGVIRGAFANVFTKVLTSPFSMLGSMFGGREDENLQELEFEPGTTQLERRSVSRLQKLEDILYQRPGLQLVIHGAADPDTDNTPAFRKAHLFDRLRDTWQTTATPGSEKTSETAPPPFADEDYRAAVRQAYLESTNTPDSTGETSPDADAIADTLDAAPPADPPVATAPDLTATDPQSPPRRTLRGGEIMVRSRLRALSQPSPATADPVPPELPTETAETSAPPLPTFEEMEQQLLNDLELTSDDWRQLAAKRAALTRQQLLETSRIEPERIPTPETEDPVPPGTKVRLDLQ